MLVHFPVALWPTHWGLHVASGWLPTGLAGVAGFWLLAAGTVLGWLAAACGALDLLRFSRNADQSLLNRGLLHGGVNGSIVLGFTVLLGLEWRGYPGISHGSGWLTIEAVLLGAMLAGNYLGGTIDWRRP